MRLQIEFVKCTESKEPQLKYWGPGAYIFFKCQCGKYFSLDTPERNDHLIRYTIVENRARGETWDVFYKHAIKKVEENPEKYKA